MEEWKEEVWREEAEGKRCVCLEFDICSPGNREERDASGSRWMKR